MATPLQFASHYDSQEVFVWSNGLLDLGTDFSLVTWSLYEMCSSPFFRTLYLDRPTELDTDTGETELPVDLSLIHI